MHGRGTKAFHKQRIERDSRSVPAPFQAASAEQPLRPVISCTRSQPECLLVCGNAGRFLGIGFFFLPELKGGAEGRRNLNRKNPEDDIQFLAGAVVHHDGRVGDVGIQETHPLNGPQDLLHFSVEERHSAVKVLVSKERSLKGK